MKVFSKEKYLSIEKDFREDVWLDICDGKNIEECKKLGFIISNKWLVDESIKIKNIYDFQDIVICALRYALGRKTYVTKSTADFIKSYPEIIDKRVKQVMLKDLENYFLDRAIWPIKDDECDYDTWRDLYEWLKGFDKE